jgi:HK97 family phage prohead protease
LGAFSLPNTQPEWKILPLTDAKVSSGGNGSLTGYASTFGNLDSYGDTVQPGAYTTYLDQFVSNGFIAWNHNWSAMIGTIASAKQDTRGLLITADFHSTPEAQAARTITAERLARGKSVGLSIGYQATRWSMGEMPDGDPVRVLEEIKVFETSLVSVPADSYAGVLGVKSHPLTQRPSGLWFVPGLKSLDGLNSRETFDALTDDEKLAAYYDLEEKATWTTAYVNNLPDSAFALIEAGGAKDGEGKTTPRSLRHFPHHDAGGSPDAPHVRNALARIPQSFLSTAEKARAESHMQSHADAMRIGKAAEPEDDATDSPERFADHYERVLLEVSTLATRSAEIADLRAKAGRVLSDANRRRLTSLSEQLGELQTQIADLLTSTESVPPPEDPKAQQQAEIEQLFARFEAFDAAHRDLHRLTEART